MNKSTRKGKKAEGWVDGWIEGVMDRWRDGWVEERIKVGTTEFKMGGGLKGCKHEQDDPRVERAKSIRCYKKSKGEHGREKKVNNDTRRPKLMMGWISIRLHSLYVQAQHRTTFPSLFFFCLTNFHFWKAKMESAKLMGLRASLLFSRELRMARERLRALGGGGQVQRFVKRVPSDTSKRPGEAGAQDAVVRLVLSNPERANALTGQMIAELADAVQTEVENSANWQLYRQEEENEEKEEGQQQQDKKGAPPLQPRTRCIILEGDGDRHFCAGSDLNLLTNATSTTVNDMLDVMHVSEKPSTTLVHHPELSISFLSFFSPSRSLLSFLFLLVPSPPPFFCSAQSKCYTHLCCMASFSTVSGVHR